MEMFYLNKIFNRADYFMSGWQVRRKTDVVFFDVTAARGQLAQDYKKESLLKQINQLVTQDYKITQLKAEATELRYDVLVAMEKLPGMIVKRLNSKDAHIEEYDFSYGLPAIASTSRKRHWEGLNKVPSIPPIDVFAETWRQKDNNETPAKRRKPATEAVMEIIHAPAGRRARKNRKLRSKKSVIRGQQFTAICDEVTDLVSNLELKEDTQKTNAESETHPDSPIASTSGYQHQESPILSDYDDNTDSYGITPAQECELLGTGEDTPLQEISVEEVTFLLDDLVTDLDSRLQTFR